MFIDYGDAFALIFVFIFMLIFILVLINLVSVKRIKQSADKQQQYPNTATTERASPIHTLVLLYVSLCFIDFCFHFAPVHRRRKK